MHTYVYGIQTIGDKKYFRSEKEARAYREANPPEDTTMNFSLGKLSKHGLMRDKDNNLFINSGNYGMPKIIQVEPSKESFETHEKSQDLWFEL